MMYKSTDHGSDIKILFHGDSVCYILKHLNMNIIYYMVIMLFSNYTEELSFASFFYTV